MMVPKLKELQTLKLYMPLIIKTYDIEDEYGYHEAVDEPLELSICEVTNYLDEILEAIEIRAVLTLNDELTMNKWVRLWYLEMKYLKAMFIFLLIPTTRSGYLMNKGGFHPPTLLSTPKVNPRK